MPACCRPAVEAQAAALKVLASRELHRAAWVLTASAACRLAADVQMTPLKMLGSRTLQVASLQLTRPAACRLADAAQAGADVRHPVRVWPMTHSPGCTCRLAAGAQATALRVLTSYQLQRAALQLTRPAACRLVVWAQATALWVLTSDILRARCPTAQLLPCMGAGQRLTASVACRLAAGAQATALRVLTSDTLREYWRQLIHGYARRQTFRPQRHADAIPLHVSLKHPVHVSPEVGPHWWRWCLAAQLAGHMCVA